MYLEIIGKIIANLWSLESLLRLTLAVENNQQFKDIFGMDVGSKQKENYIVGYYQLSTLIDLFNNLPNNRFNLNKDEILDIRHLISHGRITIEDKENYSSWVLYKFSDRDINNEFTLQKKIFISKEEGKWLKESNKFLVEQMHKVSARNGENVRYIK